MCWIYGFNWWPQMDRPVHHNLAVRNHGLTKGGCRMAEWDKLTLLCKEVHDIHYALGYAWYLRDIFSEPWKQPIKYLKLQILVISTTYHQMNRLLSICLSDLPMFFQIKWCYSVWYFCNLLLINIYSPTFKKCSFS